MEDSTECGGDKEGQQMMTVQTEVTLTEAKDVLLTMEAAGQDGRDIINFKVKGPDDDDFQLIQSYKPSADDSEIPCNHVNTSVDYSCNSCKL